MSTDQTSVTQSNTLEMFQVMAETAADGTLVDFYVFQTNEGVWKTLLEALPSSNYPGSFEIDGEPCALEHWHTTSKSQEASLGRSLVLRIQVGTLSIHGLYDPDEIEFWVHPRDADTLEKCRALNQFLIWLSTTLKRDVLVCPDNHPDHPHFRVGPPAPTLAGVALYEETFQSFGPVLSPTHPPVNQEIHCLPLRTQLNVWIDQDVLEWFRSRGRGYQTEMNLLLRAYMDAHRDATE